MNPNTSEIELGGHTYAIGKMSAMQQFHVMRRIAPLLTSLGGNLASFKDAKGAEEMAAILEPLAQAMAQMKDEEANYVIFACLRVVSRKQSDGRFQILVPEGRQALMFEDVGMADMLRLTAEVIKWNLMGFFEGLTGA